MNAQVVVVGESGQPVIDGAFVAFMMDTYGLRLPDYAAMMRRRGMGFSVTGFIRDGVRRGWSLQLIANYLLEELPPGLTEAYIYRLVAKVHGSR
jgi:hypothetical protein